MVDFLSQPDLSDSASYEKACEYMDVDSFADYCAFEIYIINEDWPGKNWGLWRTEMLTAAILMKMENGASAHMTWKWEYTIMAMHPEI